MRALSAARESCCTSSAGAPFDIASFKVSDALSKEAIDAALFAKFRDSLQVSSKEESEPPLALNATMLSTVAAYN